MNRNRIIKVILGVLTVLLVVWFCVLFYQDGYARDYGIYRSRTLLLMAVVLLLCCVVLFFYGSFFCKKGIGKWKAWVERLVKLHRAEALNK